MRCGPFWREGGSIAFRAAATAETDVTVAVSLAP